MTTPPNATNNNDIADRLYDVASAWVENNAGVTVPTLIPLATHLMAAVQKMTANGNGEKKKLAVVHVVKRLIDDTVKEDGEKTTMLLMVNNLLPTAIDAIIALTSSGALRKWWKHVRAACCRGGSVER